MSESVGFNPQREVRFAVVMYGGVSLAIYINGVAQELLNMVRATAPKSVDSDEALIGTKRVIWLDGGVSKTRPVSRWRPPEIERSIAFAHR